MWPMKLDMTREECRGVLRRLELESYGTVISTFRAQGFLSKEKMRILEDLRRILHITHDRHKAEARRAANDERLTTVAEIISGPNSGQEWRREGHRTFPVLPRTVPYTALTYIANTVYEQLTRANTKLPHPADTSCDRLKKSENMLKFELVKEQLSLFESGFVRDAAVVTSDPLQDIMSKSYINREEKPAATAKPVENKATESKTDEAVPTSNGEKPTEPREPDPDRSSLCDILLSTSNRAENNDTKSHDKNNTSVERSSRKKPQGTKRTWKAKLVFPPAKRSKQGPPKNVKQASRVNNMQSPHLIHSYAVPFDAKGSTTNGATSSEPLQLQQHLTSTVPQTGQQNNQGNAAAQATKAQPFGAPGTSFVPPGNNAPSTMYSHQQGILPSSKKDIQYNLFTLKPTSNLGMRGNMNIPLRGAGIHTHGKSLPSPFLNYQKKSPSKNILISTTTSAATLASLGFPSPLHPPLPDHSGSWLSTKIRDKTAKQVKTIPTISTSTTTPLEAATERSSTSSSTEPKQSAKQVEVATENVEQNAEQKSSVFNSPTVSNNTVQTQTMKSTSELVPNNSNKGTMQPVQLVPASGAPQSTASTTTAQKNNVFILPKSSAVAGVLNLGQKITIPKSMVDSSTTASTVISPPKVIVQTMPNPYSPTTITLPALQSTGDRKNVVQQGSRFTGVTEMLNNSNSTTKVANESSVDGRAQESAKQSPFITIPYDGVSGRKIKISTSQLVPFKGTLHASPFQTKNAASIKIGAKNIKIGTDNDSSVAAGIFSALSGKSSTDREGEQDRPKMIPAQAHETPSSSSTTIDTKADNMPAGIMQTNRTELKKSTIVKNVEENVPVDSKDNKSSKKSKDHGTQSTSSTLQNTVSLLPPSQEAIDATETAHSECDIISSDRGDDSSVTDSADTEEDLDDEPSQIEEDEYIEEDDFNEEQPVDVEMNTDALIIEEEQANYDYLIEEVPGDEEFLEEHVDDELVEYVNDDYGTTEELVAELESGTSSQKPFEKHRSANGQDELPSEINYEQSKGGYGTIENGEMQTFTLPDGVVCDLMEMGSDGKYRARPYSYKQESVPKASQQTHPIVRLS
uniref:ENT domain-containing protein n=1 Tax=Anopheles epiroticus TaxID=199890 RepID=A0A182PVQ8_9DIPT